MSDSRLEWTKSAPEVSLQSSRPTLYAILYVAVKAKAKVDVNHTLVGCATYSAARDIAED